MAVVAWWNTKDPILPARSSLTLSSYSDIAPCGWRRQLYGFCTCKFCTYKKRSRPFLQQELDNHCWKCYTEPAPDFRHPWKISSLEKWACRQHLEGWDDSHQKTKDIAGQNILGKIEEWRKILAMRFASGEMFGLSRDFTYMPELHVVVIGNHAYLYSWYIIPLFVTTVHQNRL